MDEDRSASDPPRRARLLSPPGGQPQAPRAPSLPMDLSSQYQRRFSTPLFLPPPMAPRGLAPPGSAFSAFSNYQGPPAAPGGSHLARPLTKTPFFSTDSLAPLPYSADPAAGAVAAVPRSPPSLGGSEQQGASPSGLPPRGAGHRRSLSDFLIGFSLQNKLPLALPMLPPAEGYSKSADAAALEELFRSYRDPRALAVLGSPNERNSHLLGNQVMSGQRAWSPADSSDNETESWATASGGGGTSHPRRHCRSLSVDSIMGSLNFGALSPTVLPRPPSLASGSGAGASVSHTGSGPSGAAVAVATSELANGEFTESEMKKIMANDRLAELALADPRRVKRILANRISAAKSKERKVRYMGELERRVHVLQMETSTLSSKVSSSQRECETLKAQNNEMKIRLQAMGQQAHLKDALNQALGAEVQRLKQAAGETSDAHAWTGSLHHLNRQILEQQLLQLQQPAEDQKVHQQQ
ncbi:hypothetical protein HU200_000723 [Digitaria exilis]|uniref:BZIP domain-containing protein n=1 Tax=Digitaria exilis TaxID=1010633 RepID=A0A835FXR6_9POAL|nr:hypothetical protein HU200_000723 [Digitaria exilis]CAB3457633.1 unnamed protein product [Digitaria exilis]